MLRYFIPFFIGFFGAFCYSLYALYHIVWEYRETGPYADEWYVECWNRIEKVNWIGVIGIPIVVGLVVFVCWWLIALVMGVTV